MLKRQECGDVSGALTESAAQKWAEHRCLEICLGVLEQLSGQMTHDGDPNVLFNGQEMRVCVCRDLCVNFMEKLEKVVKIESTSPDAAVAERSGHPRGPVWRCG